MSVMMPVLLFPAALVWYVNVTGLFEVMKTSLERRKRRPAGAGKVTVMTR
jgi:hypothetical protein